MLGGILNKIDGILWEQDMLFGRQLLLLQSFSFEIIYQIDFGLSCDGNGNEEKQHIGINYNDM